MRLYDQERCIKAGVDEDAVATKETRSVTLTMSLVAWRLIELDVELEDLPLEMAMARMLETLAADRAEYAMKINTARIALANGELTKPAQRLYFMRRGKDGPIKIGVSADHDKRAKAIQTGSDERVRVLASCEQTDELNERSLHDRFAEHRKEGEWFEPCAELLALIERVRMEQVSK